MNINPLKVLIMEKKNNNYVRRIAQGGWIARYTCVLEVGSDG